MAKPTQAVPAVVSNSAILSADLSYGAKGEYKVNPQDLPAKTLTRLLENGFTQMLSDVGALSTEQKVRIIGKLRGTTYGKDNPVPTGKAATAIIESDFGKEALADHVHQNRLKKIQAMLDETLGEGGGTRLDPVSREMRNIAEAKIAAAAKRVRKKLSDEQAKKLVSDMIERDEKILRKQAEENLANIAKGADDLDLDALLAQA